MLYIEEMILKHLREKKLTFAYGIQMLCSLVNFFENLTNIITITRHLLDTIVKNGSKITRHSSKKWQFKGYLP